MPAKRCACPIATPPDTPMPWIVKQTSEPVVRVPSGVTYSPSPNLSLKSPSIAAMAASSSGPSVSSSTVEPRPAASIMTPMMLLALTRRPLRAIQTALWNFDAVCVSLAEARACKPSLLLILTERLSMRRLAGVGHAQDSLARPRERLLEHHRERLVAIGERADQHRQVHARQPLDAPGVEQLRRDVRGRGAVDVGQHQHALPLVEEADQILGHRKDGFGVVVDRHAQLPQEERALAENVARRVDQRLAEGAVGNDQDANHVPIL